MYVGTMQDFGVPYSSLYVDTEKRLLYLLVRVSSTRDTLNEYAAAIVSPREVEEYMNVGLGLSDIFRDKPCFVVRISNGNVIVEKECAECADSIDDSMNMFDPDFCADDIWLETFIDRFKNNKPLMVTHSEEVKPGAPEANY